mmetsp:Transcript_10323/g.14332  ORF Transcript_10323/g.14332 Transcript_10323/m.14332 type:complete len:123 (-) Transcript_10323:442-810(-)
MFKYVVIEGSLFLLSSKRSLLKTLSHVAWIVRTGKVLFGERSMLVSDGYAAQSRSPHGSERGFSEADGEAEEDDDMNEATYLQAATPPKLCPPMTHLILLRPRSSRAVLHRSTPRVAMRRGA